MIQTAFWWIVITKNHDFHVELFHNKQKKETFTAFILLTWSRGYYFIHWLCPVDLSHIITKKAFLKGKRMQHIRFYYQRESQSHWSIALGGLLPLTECHSWWIQAPIVPTFCLLSASRRFIIVSWVQVIAVWKGTLCSMGCASLCIST